MQFEVRPIAVIEGKNKKSPPKEGFLNDPNTLNKKNG